MSRIGGRFSALKQQGRAGLVTYLTAGDPDLATTEKLIPCLEKAGADIIELGVPFSDPAADGPTIQAASDRALKNPFSLDKIFSLVEKVRKQSQVPILLFGYYNPIFKYGEERFVSVGQEAGVDGLLVVDLPPEEGEGLGKFCGRAGMDLVYCLALTSTDQRIELVTRAGTGFIYYVSVTGVTGARTELSQTIARDVARIKRKTSLPVAVGFGISTPDQAREVARHAEGVVVGSALVKVIEQYGRSPELIPRVREFVAGLKAGISSARG
jgi:tryptophan synthase alpha chain